MPNPHIETAQTQFWSLALQRSLARNTVLEFSYSGAHGVHLYDIENINLLGAGQAYLGDPLTFPQSPDCPSPCLNRPNDQYSNINERGSLGQSSYNAFNIRFQTQDYHNTGLGLSANYTYSHSIDNISSTFSDSLQGGSGDIGSLGYTDLLDPGLDLGPSDFDIRNRFVLAPIWNLPWFSTSSNWQGQALGGWLISGIFTARTGTPFTVYDYSNVFNFYTIPRLSPATPITKYHVAGSPQVTGPNSFLGLTVPIPANYNAAIGNFEPLNPALGISDFGPYPANMTSRNSFRGPGAWNIDAAVGKTFKVTERFQVQFRAEGFDVFNHHNYYTNTTNTYYDGPATDPVTGLPIPPPPLQVSLLKGGLGTLATGGNHDERRFGQFSLRLSF